MPKSVKPPVDRLIKSGLFSKPRAPQDAPHLYGKLIFFPVWCKKCGLCFKSCPAEAITWEKKTVAVIDKEKCIKCMSCYDKCKFDAIL